MKTVVLKSNQPGTKIEFKSYKEQDHFIINYYKDGELKFQSHHSSEGIKEMQETLGFLQL